MTDREKAILGLECHKAGFYEECLKCPYHDDGCETTLCNDAIALLQEQEPVEPRVANGGLPDNDHGTWWYECGLCGTPVDPCDEYCRKCGKKVKWDA
jgi:hypothetical protein